MWTAVPASDDSRITQFSSASDIVELVVLSADQGFLRTLREAAGSSHRLWHVSSADKVVSLLAAGQVGILVMDQQALQEPVGPYLARIKRQFPALVILAACRHDAETELAGSISDGTVYRLIHKPASPARARLFTEAAVKKYVEQRRLAVNGPAADAVSPRRRWLGVGAGVLLAIASAAMWWHHHAASTPEPMSTGTPATGTR